MLRPYSFICKDGKTRPGRAASHAGEKQPTFILYTLKNGTDMLAANVSSPKRNRSLLEHGNTRLGTYSDMSEILRK